MKYIKIVLIVKVCISSTFMVFGQHKKDTIFFSQDEIVREIHTTEKYVGIFGTNSMLRKPMGILYSRSGEKLFEHLPDSANLFDFIPNDRYNQIILINKISNYPVQYKDELVALDIDTKSIKWKARSVAPKYIISPDGKYIMTGSSVSSADEIKSEFGIINLVDGSMLPINFDLGDDYNAIWYDTQRVILYTRKWERKRNDQYFEATEKYQNELKKVNKEKEDLNLEYRQNRLTSKQYYTIQTQKLNNKIDSIDEEYNSRLMAQPKMVGDTTTTQFIGRPFDFSTKSLNFIMYNIVTQEIEYAKSYDPDDNILASLRYNSCGTISVDQDKNIYVLDYKDRFHQLDSKFNVNWSIKVKQPYAVYKILDSDSIFFVVDNRGVNEYRIISKNGKEQLLNTTDNPIIMDRIKRETRSYIIDLKSGIEFDGENNLLIFKE